MKILVLFAALAISHFMRGIDRYRQATGLFAWLGQLQNRWSHVPAIELILIFAVAVIGGGLLSILAELLGGDFLWALVSLVVLLFTLGPRDLDQDVEHALEADEPGHSALGITPEADAHEAGVQIYFAALSRWFGVIFWFVVLGIPGALLYRITEQVCEQADEDIDRSWVLRLRFFLEWPVLVLMMVASAMTNDFDRVYQAWHRYRRTVSDDEGRSWLIHRHLLVELSDAVLPEGLDQRGGIQLAHHFVWRMLILWLVVLSVLLLAGWLG